MPEQITPKLLSWATDVDDNTIEQARKSSELPFIAGHVALMPDAHFGMGATVGSVIPTKGAIIPSAIGVDIGCGMIAGLTSLVASELPDDLSWLHGGIAQRIPAGIGPRGEHKELYDVPLWPWIHEGSFFDKHPESVGKARKQMGTLGSGNHFVEVCLDERERVWIVLHSGSRGVGNKIAQFHIEKAKGLMERYFIELPHKDLAYLVERTPEFGAYIEDMLWAQEYAMANREEMLRHAVGALQREMGDKHVGLIDQINCHHNYTEKEHHGRENVWVTRKGAVRAREGDRGVIPGSMGAASYIVSGLGNPASYHSCAHGAGRRLSRTAARKQLSTESLQEAMAGKTWNNQPRALLDEHPDAYKDIDVVMENQKDLVKVEHTLHQILNYKGA